MASVNPYDLANGAYGAKNGNPNGSKATAWAGTYGQANAGGQQIGGGAPSYLRNVNGKTVDTRVMPTKTDVVNYKNSLNSGGGGGGGGSVATASAPAYDPRQSLIDYYTRQNESAKKSALDAIEARLKTQLGIYDNQFSDMNDNYDALINQAEVNYYKSKSALRESLANRGQLDSGLGRQEALNLGVARGNELGSINRQRQKSWDEYNNSKASLRAEAEADKATIENQYATELRNTIAQILAQIV